MYVSSLNAVQYHCNFTMQWISKTSCVKGRIGADERRQLNYFTPPSPSSFFYFCRHKWWLPREFSLRLGVEKKREKKDPRELFSVLRGMALINPTNESRPFSRNDLPFIKRVITWFCLFSNDFYAYAVGLVLIEILSPTASLISARKVT